MSCQEMLSLGAYVLGALEPEERRQIREHVSRCPACAAELAELAELPALLDRIRPEDLPEEPVTASPHLFDRVAAAAAAEQRRAVRRRWLLVAAALLVLVLGGTGVTIWATRSPELTRSVAVGDVRMTVTASDANDGTALDVRVSGLAPQEGCHLIAVDHHGDWHKAGWWEVPDSGDAAFRGWTELHRSELTEVVLVGTGGDELVRLRL